MAEIDYFSHFSITKFPPGRLRVTFHLRVPDWQVEDEAGKDFLSGVKTESVFDESSLILRIANLSAAGQDRSMSEAALAALRAAKAGSEGAAAPAKPPPMAAVVEAASDLIMVTTADFAAGEHVVLYSNAAVTGLTGQPPDAFAGANWRSLLTAGADRDLAAGLEAQLALGMEAEACLACASGTGDAIQVQFRVTPLRDPATRAITHFSWIGRRLATKATPVKQGSSLAAPDRANGAADLAALLAVLDEDLRAATMSPTRGPCLALFSIDGIDDIEHRFGKSAAEAVRLAVGDRLAEHARRADFVARTGENEFGIHMPGVMLAHGRLAVKRIRRAIISNAVETPSGPVEIALRVGIAEAVRGSDGEAAACTVARLMASAEASLGEARAARRLVTSP